MLEFHHCPNKQQQLQKHPQKKFQDDSINDSNSIKMIPTIRNQILSASNQFNDFSLDSQFLDKSSLLEQSLEQELRLWKEQYKIDPGIVNRIEQQIRCIDTQINQLATQFEVSQNLQKKTHIYFQEFQQIVRGTTFTKFSRANSKKIALRTIFYCPFLDAICWKSKSSKFPSTKQLIPVDQITQIHTNYQKYKIFRKNFIIPKTLNEELFLAIEGRNGYRLELIAENKQERDLYIRTLNQLIDSNEKSINHSFFIEQYTSNIDQIKKGLDFSKFAFVEAMEKLQYNFIQTTTALLQQEKEKNIFLKKQSCHIINQNKQQINQLDEINHQQKKQILDLQLQKEYFEQKIVQLQEFYNMRTIQFKSSSNPQLSQINQLLKDILALNGDISIYNESVIEIPQATDIYQDCQKSISKISNVLNNYSTLEVQLREKIEQLQVQNQQLMHLIDKQKTEITDCEGINQMLQKKLIDFNFNMESKEQQFHTVIKEIQSLKQHLPCRLSTSQSQSEYSVKVGEQDNLLKFFCHIIPFIFFLYVPEELSNDIEEILQGFFVKLSAKFVDFVQIAILIKQIKKVYQSLETQYTFKFESMIKEEIFQYYNFQQSTNKKNIPSPSNNQNKLNLADKTFQSPSNKLFLKNKASFYKKQSVQSLDPQQIKYLSQLVK